MFITPAVIKDRDISSIGWMRVVGPIGTTVGSLMMAATPIFGITIPVVSAIGAVLTGVASGWLWLLWGDFNGQVELELSEFIIPASVAIPLIVIFFSSFSQGPIAGFFVCTLPLVSGFLLELSLRDETVKDPVELLSPEERPDFWSDFIHVGVGSLVIYAAISFIWSLLRFGTFAGWGGVSALPFLVGGILAIVISAISILYSTRLDLFALYRWLIPVIVCSLALFSVYNFWSWSLAYVLITMAQFGFDIIVWVYFTGIVRKGICRGSLAIGVNRGFVQAGILIGSVIGTHTPSWVASGRISFPSICLILICALVAVTLSVLNHKEKLEHNIQTSVPQKPAVDDTDIMCDILASKNSLTARETEILKYLARGRSLPYVRETLILSKNTVETHAKNLYRKLGIHSRQELIDLVENYKL
ncbi:MAG: helix-turn-helix transcriptional regulator [Actinobacteria bacterium]|nr:helix-turn-helix transcriptional regulator [Actinomycetota bacterium]